MSATEPPADLRNGLVYYIHQGINGWNEKAVIDAILRLCEAAALAALPDKEGAYEETRRIGCVDDDAQKGYRLAIATYQANIHSVFGSTGK